MSQYSWLIVSVEGKVHQERLLPHSLLEYQYVWRIFRNRYKDSIMQLAMLT